MEIREAYEALAPLHRRYMHIEGPLMEEIFVLDTGDTQLYEILDHERQTAEWTLWKLCMQYCDFIHWFYDTPQWAVFRKLDGWDPMWNEFQEMIGDWGLTP